ncbi:ABC transporter substrate-binding protein [Roseomonas sp. BN140053]|uniref:ABC transporter substrate-binding protein n=1 Tax=Roseomonas sp. BN140053 TaxID=3391898 RepID=UPI0039E94448
MFEMRRRGLLAGTAALAALGGTAGQRARAAGRPVKIAVLNDMSGVYADYQGQGSVIGTELAVADAVAATGQRAEVIFGDHQNKPDIGANLARRWLDTENVDMIIDVPNSAIALAVAELCRERNKVFIGSGAGTSDLTGVRCSPNTVHWTYDTWSVGQSLGRAVTEAGSKRWFLLVADYAFGYDLEKNVTEAVLASGGTIAGVVRHPLGNSDYSSFLVRAGRDADVLGLCNAGGDNTTSIKQAAEFGLNRRMKIVGPVVNINVIQGLGLRDAQGLLAATPFYWDHDDSSREFSRRFQARHPRRIMPNDMQAGCYAATLHYLKAVAGGADPGDGRAVVSAMKALPTDDPLFGRGTIRADGRKVHPLYIMETKGPQESRGEWDYFKQVSTVPPEQAYRPLNAGSCSLVR